MANVSFNLSSQGWSTISDALTNGPGTGTITIWYDDSAQGSTTALELGDILYPDDNGAPSATAFDGGGDYWYWNDSTVGTAIEIDANGVVQSINVVNFGPGDAGLNIADGTNGLAVLPNVTTTAGTATAVNPSVYANGTNTYDVTITVPAGYSNSGFSITAQDSANGSPATTTSYGISSNVSTVNEGGTVIITATASQQGDTVGYTISGVQSADFTGSPSLTGTFDFSSSSSESLTLTLEEDFSIGEGNETLVVTLDATDSSGNTAGQAVSVSIVDTSADTPPQITASSSQTVQYNTQANIDFAGLTQLQTAEGESSATSTWEIVALPQFGSLSANGTPVTNTGALPPGTPGVFSVVYTPTTNYQGGDSIQWRVSDGNQYSVTGTITLNVQGPQNQAPVATDITQQITATTSTAFNFTRTAADATELPVSFEWWDPVNNTAFADVNALNQTLQHGTVAFLGGETYSYTNTTTIPVGGSNVAEVFYYRAVDSGTPPLDDVAQISLTLTAAANQDPTINYSGSTTGIALESGVAFQSGQITATDPDGGQTITIAIDPSQTSGTATTSVLQFDAATGILNVQANSGGTLSVTLVASDGQGGTDSITFTFNVSAATNRAIKKSAWANSSDSACGLARPATQPYYYSTGAGAATWLEDLVIGDIIYQDGALSIPVAPTSGSATWFSGEETKNNVVYVRAIKIGTGGVIEEIVNCQVTGGQAWELEVKYNADTLSYCDGIYEQGVAWQNVADGATLEQVVAAGGQLFASEYYANQYLNNDAPSQLTLADGAYADLTMAGDQYYIGGSTGWTQNPGGPVGSGSAAAYLYDCPVPINYTTKVLNVYWYADDPTDIGAICNAQGDGWLNNQARFSQIPIYYRAQDGETLDLLGIARNQRVIYATSLGANNLDYNLMFPNAVLIDPTSGGFVIWDKDDNTGYNVPGQISARWYAFDPDDSDGSTVDNKLEIAQLSSVLGNCGDNALFSQADYTRPPLGAIPIDYTATDPSRDKVFYAFYSCDVALDAGIPGGDPYFPLYIVDGMHTVQQYNEVGISYMLDFIREIKSTDPALTGRTQINTGTQCMTFWSTVEATNIEDAATLLSDKISELEDTYQGIIDGGMGEAGTEANVDARPLGINAVDLGFGSQAQIQYKQLDAGEAGDSLSTCYTCATDLSGYTTYTFPGLNDAEIVNRHIPNFDLDKNYNLDNLSRPLLRTNPRLSTNAKIVANISDQIFIESIDATKELASVEYKKWELNPNGDWSRDLYKFYKNNYTPSDIIYATRSDYSDFTVQDSFENQIEEVYHYGTTYNYSKLHPEDFRILAPIWLDKDIPNKFVIFRVSNPVGSLDFDDRSNFDNIQDLLKNSEIVQTYDLTDDSALGSYIRKHVNSESFPKSPVQFNFARGEKSSFRGIDLKKGGFASKGEYLHKDFVRADNPLIASNAIITDGFVRNDLACANLINLEFLFNDNTAADYDVNRYFGLYVNDIDSGYGSVDTAENGIVKFKTLNSYINDEPSSAIPSFKQISQSPVLGYVSVSDEYYKISPKSAYEPNKLTVNVEDSGNKIPSQIKLAPNGNSVDIVKREDAGSDFVKFTVTDNPLTNNSFTIFESKESAYSITFLRYAANEQVDFRFNNVGVDPNAGINFFTGATIEDTFVMMENQATDNIKMELVGNTIYISELNATLGDLDVRFTTDPANVTLTRVDEIQTSVEMDSSTFVAVNLPAGEFNGNQFSRQGTTSDVARAIVASIKNSSINFTAIYEDGASEFYVKSNIKGYRLLQSGVLVPNTNTGQFLSIENRDLATTALANGLLKLDSLVLSNNSVHFMNGGNSANKSVLVTKDSVASIAIGDFIATPTNGVYNKVVDIVDDISVTNSEYRKLILEDNNYLESGEQKVYADNVARIGLFSAYDIHDMNFDFYDRDNSELKELDYELSGNGSADDPNIINYEPDSSTSNQLTVFGEDYKLKPVDYFTGINDTLPEETLDAYNEIKLYSEYDRLEENSLKEFAVRSRVVPNINKWVLKDTLTVREQPYYLNANEAFGQTNFAPNFGSIGRDRLGMTHEWFYMDNMPKYLQYNQYNDTFSYVNFIDGFELTPEHFKSTQYDYFDRFMVTEGFEYKDAYDLKSFIKTNLQKKYTKVSGGNEASFASTIFKGIKVDFKNRKEFVNIKGSEFVRGSEFNDYKFSTLVMVRGGRAENNISYEVIQNKKFKFVIFLITVSLDDLWIDGALNRKLLYEMNHSFLWNGETNRFVYSDVALSGALDLNSMDWSTGIIQGIPHSSGSQPAFLDQINADENNEFGSLDIIFPTSSGSTQISLKIKSVDDQGQITIESATGPNGQITSFATVPGYVQDSAEYIYRQGGKNAFTTILDSLSVASVNDLLRRNDGSIVYTTIETDGTSLNNRFEIEFENGVEIIKESQLVTIADEDKPKTFKLKKGTIGFVLAAGDTYYPFLVRHNGNYTVDTKPVVTFTDMYSHFKTNTLQSTINSAELGFEESMYKHSLTDPREIKLARDYYRRYNRCGIAFNLGFITDDGSHDAGWGVIKNHFYRKVNEVNAAAVTKLSTTTDKLPLYPLIGEVAIDKKDVNVFKSSWDKNYYTRSLSGGLNELVPGTFETKEERSYLGSTIMKPTDSFTLLNYTVQKAETKEELDSILENNINTTDVVTFEDKKYIYVDFYITTAIKTQLAKDGVLESISRFVQPVDSAGDKTTLKDDAQLYIENNLLNVFNLDIIKLYTQRVKGVDSEILSTATIDNLDDGGYAQDRNFTFKQHEQQPLNFRLIYNKRLGYSYRIRPMIKIQS